MDEEQRARLQAVLDKQDVYTLGFYNGTAIANVENVTTKQEALRKLKVMLKKAKLDPEKLHAVEPLDLFDAEKWGWVIPYAKPVTISAGSSTDPPPAAPTPATVAWLGKEPANLTVVRASGVFRQLEWLQYRAGLCGIELKKEPESFPAFLALYRDITRYAEGDKKNRLAGAKNVWLKFTGNEIKVKALSWEMQDKITRINEGAPEELCPCGQALLFTKPFGQLCSEACMKRFCPKCRGPKIEVEGEYTEHQSKMIDEAHELHAKAMRLRKRARYQAYMDRASELQMAAQRLFHPLDVFAGLNGLCCRNYIMHGRNPDGTQWCTERPYCRWKFESFGGAFSDDVKRGEGPEAWVLCADDLMAKARAINAQVGPMPTMNVCEPCAAKRKLRIGWDFVHMRIQDHHERVAKRQRVD